MAIRVTQVGKEIWYSGPVGNLRATQVGTEVWYPGPVGNLRITQIGLEVWRTTTSTFGITYQVSNTITLTGT